MILKYFLDLIDNFFYSIWWNLKSFSYAILEVTMNQSNNQNRSSGGGLSIVHLVGAVLSAYLSWTLNHSVFWCAVHAICGWFYVIYLCCGCGGGLPDNFW